MTSAPCKPVLCFTEKPNPKPAYYAFFDVDGTIINIKSMISFLDFFHAQSSLTTKIGYRCYKLLARLLEWAGASREYLNGLYYKQYKQYQADLINSAGRAWFADLIKTNANLFFPEVLQEIKRHQANNAEIVFVSGSFDACLKPLADLLHVKYILATSLESKEGFFTGNIHAPQVIGRGKAEVILSFLEKNKFENPSACFGYGDHHSDYPMLEVIGNAFLVKEDGSLIKYKK